MSRCLFKGLNNISWCVEYFMVCGCVSIHSHVKGLTVADVNINMGTGVKTPPFLEHCRRNGVWQGATTAWSCSDGRDGSLCPFLVKNNCVPLGWYKKTCEGHRLRRKGRTSHHVFPTMMTDCSLQTEMNPSFFKFLFKDIFPSNGN